MSNTPAKGGKALPIILALLLIAAVVFGVLATNQKNDLATQVTNLTKERDDAIANVTKLTEEAAAKAQAEADKLAEEAAAAAAAAEEAAKAAAEGAAEVAEEATEAVEGAAEEVAEEATEVVEEATEAVEGAAEEVAEEATEVVEEATEAVEGAAEEVAEEATEVVEEATEALTGEVVELNLYNNKVEINEALQNFAKIYNEKHPGVNVKVESVGGGADYSGNLTARLTADQMPDIFVIEGDGDYNLWKDYLTDLSNEPWNANTTLAYQDPDGKVVGFPVAIEGFGLGYNVELLKKADIDPATLTTFSALKAAFEKIEGMKAELGIDSVVSMSASVSGGTWWVAGHHNFSIYLGGGLDFTDTSVVDKYNAGEVDAARLTDYANYVKLLFDYSDQTVLATGTYDNQLAAFANQKAVFIHQGNWIDPSLKAMNVAFEYDYISHPFNDAQEYKGLYLFAPSYYVINSKADEAKIQAAKDFLNFLVSSEEGANYMVNEAGMVPAFSNITLEPAGGFSKALVRANAAGGNYGVYFGKLPAGTGQSKLAPIFDVFAQKHDDEGVTYLVNDLTKLATDLAAGK